ncbi:TIGR01620 family protein [Motiliproteus sp.]|uniref:TIGR01620 family protein n=1 Tax=Motiliproteus sp. TaxID=1898955 RepID=UPI003BAABBE8
MSDKGKHQDGFSFVPDPSQQLDADSTDKIEETVEPGTFVPSREQTLEAPPESISADSQAGSGSAQSSRARESLQLQARPVRGLKALFALLGLYVVWLLGQSSYQQYQLLTAQSSILAAAFLALLAALLLVVAWVLLQWVCDKDRYARVRVLQTQAEHFRAVRSHRKSDAFMGQLTAFYRDKPQSPELGRALSNLPDYADDSERIALLEQQFVAPMDSDAKALVARYSMQTGVAVALSPWAAIDMLLTLWRNLKMLEEISKIYGLRPSLRNRLNILGVVLSNMVLAGVSQTLADSSQGVLEDAARSSSALLLAKTGANLGQGIGVALVTGRIGVLGMQACRPIPFAEGEVPGVGQFGRQALRSILNSRKPHS